MDIVAPSGKTISVNELALSRSGSTLNGGGESRGFWLTGSSSEVDIEYALENAPNIPRSTQRGYIYNGASWREPEVEKGDQSIWKATVEYVSPGGFRQGQVQVRVGTARLRVTAATETQKVVVPYEVVSRHAPAGKVAIPYYGIGDNGKTFTGIDVPRSVFSFAYDFNVPALQATPEYFAICDSSVGKTNSVKFKGYPIGEVYCDRIEGVYSTNEDTTLSFVFKRKENQPATTVPVRIAGQPQPPAPGDTSIAVPAYKAWDILDIHTRTTINTSPQRIKVDVTQVDIYRVFDEYDFNRLGIPGPDIRTQDTLPGE